MSLINVCNVGMTIPRMHAVFTQIRGNRPNVPIPRQMSLGHLMQSIWTPKDCPTAIWHHWHCQNTAGLPNDCHFHWFSHFPESRRFLVSFHLFTHFHFAFTFCIPNSIGMPCFTQFRWMPISHMVWLTIGHIFHSVTPLQTIHVFIYLLLMHFLYHLSSQQTLWFPKQI